MLHRESSITLLSVGGCTRRWAWVERKEEGAYSHRERSVRRVAYTQYETIALLSYSFWPGIFHSVGTIGGWSWSELIGGESSGGSIGGCRYAANSASVSSWGIIC